jgi:cell division protein FtsQ
VSRGSGLTTRDRVDRPGAPDGRKGTAGTRKDRAARRQARRAAAGSTRRRRTTSPRATGPVTPLTARRRIGRSARRPLAWLAGLLVLAALAAFLWAGPLLSVRTIRVDGADSLAAEQVQDAAGIAEGTPLLRVDVSAAAARVARLPQVADVQVTRGWPSSVVITVVERTPLAVVEEAGRRTLVDAEGVLFDTITGKPPAGVVRLEVADPGPDDPDTRAGLAAVAALPPELRKQVTRVTAAHDGRDVRLRLTDGTEVLWGDGSESDRKAAVLGALLKQIAGGEIDPAGTVDVSAPGAVVLR